MLEKITNKQRKSIENLKPFKPGQSGNPKGRPPKVKCIPDILRKIGEEEGTIKGLTNLEMIMRKVYKYALAGKPWAIEFIADRTEGKPTQPIQVGEIEELKVIK